MIQLRRTIRRAYIALGAVAVTMAAVGTLGYRSLAGFVRQDAERRVEIHAARSLEKLVALTREAESGQRGYLLTLDTAYLEPYGRASATLPAALDAALRSPAWPPGALRAIEPHLRAKLAELDRTVALARAGRRDEALRIVREGTGRRTMVAVRVAADRLVASMDAATATREARLERAAVLALAAIPAVGGLSAVVVFAMFALAVRQAIARTAADTRARLAAEEARRNSNLLNALSHDVRLPLNAIQQSAEVAQTLACLGHFDRERFVAAMDDIKAAARSMSAMAEDFLETSRAEHGRPEPTTWEVRPLLDDVAAVVAPEVHARGLRLVVECPPGLEARADRRFVKRILLNLVGNAVKFTARGEVRIRAARDGRAAVLAVCDTGIGIAADQVDRLFGDFQQVGNFERDPSKGFGLGLSNCLRLTRRLGGTVVVDTEVGKGSTFTVTVPDADIP